MKPTRAKTLIDTLARAGVNTMVGVQTFEHAEADWVVMIAPQQIIDVVPMSMALHLRGFAIHFGPVQQQQNSPQQGVPPETWVVSDSLPEMLPEAEEVEIIGPDDFSREQVYSQPGGPGSGVRVGWRRVYDGPASSVDFERIAREERERQEADARNQQARTGGEGMWRPGP